MTAAPAPPRHWQRWKRPPKLRPDWEPRLSAFLEAAASAPHEFGVNDCILFPAGAVEAQTGRDYAKGQRGRYRSAASASRYLRGIGFRSAEELLDSILPGIPAAFAQRGDIVLSDGVPGVCIGGEALFVCHDQGDTGPERRALPRWQRAWAVGRGGI